MIKINILLIKLSFFKGPSWHFYTSTILIAGNNNFFTFVFFILTKKKLFYFQLTAILDYLFN